MKIRYTIFLLVIFGLSFPASIYSQTVLQLMKAGDKKFTNEDYYAASLYYKGALKKGAENAELNYKFAESSRMFNDYKAAVEAYELAIKSDSKNDYPLAGFWYGEMLKYLGRYDEAAKQLQKFRGRYHKKDYYNLKSQQEIESCAWAKDHIKPDASIKIEHLGSEVNTGQSEFNAIPVYPDKIQFSSLRNISSDKKKEKYLVRIYNQAPNPEIVFIPNGADPELNIGNGAYSPDSKRFYFTQCQQAEHSVSRCDIYVTSYENFKWSAAEKLSDHVNDPKATNTQPAVGYDKSGNEVLFFVSDRIGGQGNLDIWISKRDTDGAYEPAINAGDKINSPGNEVTPFYDVNNHQLFFSSDWYYGFGGYDIFETAGEYTNWTDPKNLLQPINSAQNDLYYTVTLDNARAYLTSNRVGSLYVEAETCCNDIYAYNTNKKVEKKGDTISMAKIDTPIVHHDTIPLALFQPRNFIDDKIKGSKQLLPVQLYFHNDEPDCCSLSDTTKLDYKETYEAYTGLITEYKKEYSKGLKGEEKEKAEQDIDNLFAQKVDKGFYDLVAFTGQLYTLLKTGNKMEITIKGYCSPLNYSEYNIRLGSRRVAALRNYFFHYRDGIFLPYLADGSLVLKSESLGKETAPKNVSDNLNDKRNSVFSPAAALERRVEIISVEVK